MNYYEKICLEKKNAGLFIVLHISLLFSSLSGVCSKMAAAQTDLKGFPWYVVFRSTSDHGSLCSDLAADPEEGLPLTVAYANKPVSLIWGMIWGTLIFGETDHRNMMTGAVVIFAGIYLVTGETEEKGG